ITLWRISGSPCQGHHQDCSMHVKNVTRLWPWDDLATRKGGKAWKPGIVEASVYTLNAVSASREDNAITRVVAGLCVKGSDELRNPTRSSTVELSSRPAFSCQIDR